MYKKVYQTWTRNKTFFLLKNNNLSAPWVTQVRKGRAKDWNTPQTKTGENIILYIVWVVQILTYRNGSLLIKPRTASKTFRSILLTTTVNNNSPIHDYVHPDDQIQPFEMTSGFKPFTVLLLLLLMNVLGQLKELWTHRALYMYPTKDLRSLPKPRSLFEMWSNQSVAFVEGAIKGEGKRGVRKGKWNASTYHFPSKTDRGNCQYLTNTSRGPSSPWVNLLCLSETVKSRSFLSNDTVIK